MEGVSSCLRRVQRKHEGVHTVPHLALGTSDWAGQDPVARSVFLVQVQFSLGG